MTRKTKVIYEPESDEEELCSVCGGKGTNLHREYQQSLDEAVPVRCETCSGTGVRPKGTKEAEKRRYRNNRRRYLREEIEKYAKELRDLGEDE